MKKFLLLVTVITLVTLSGISPKVARASNPQSIPIRGAYHLQDWGDFYLHEGEWAGTRGYSLRLERFSLDFPSFLSFPPGETLDFEYMCHVEGIGDTSWMPSLSYCGTKGESRRLEGFAIRLTGTLAKNYDVYYACHLQDTMLIYITKNGQFCGTRGQSRRLEAMIVWVLPKGSLPPSIPNFGRLYKAPQP